MTATGGSDRPLGRRPLQQGHLHGVMELAVEPQRRPRNALMPEADPLVELDRPGVVRARFELHAIDPLLQRVGQRPAEKPLADTLPPVPVQDAHPQRAHVLQGVGPVGKHVAPPDQATVVNRDELRGITGH